MKRIAYAVLVPSMIFWAGAGCWMNHPVSGVYGGGACSSPASQLLNKSCPKNDDVSTAALVALANGGSGSPSISVQVSGVTYANGSNYTFASSIPAYPFTILNQGSGVLVISSVTVNLTFYTLTAPSSTSISPGGSTVFSVRDSSGGGSTPITIMSNDPTTPTYTINSTPCFC